MNRATMKILKQEVTALLPRRHQGAFADRNCTRLTIHEKIRQIREIQDRLFGCDWNYERKAMGITY